MARRAVNEEHIRALQKSKGSYSISIPIGLIRDRGWKEGQKLVVKPRGQSLVVRDWKLKTTRKRKK